ncbi:MAG: carboxylating nicotinate-nucleotide diphosphorylase [Deltaproteobacteria bacterium]|nr:carboxylating nicotinate-nucleotide diphosphorylase [Deltaproteobacteria bacterium]
MTDQIQSLIELALREDIGTGDITTEALFGNQTAEKTALIFAKQDLVVAGLEIARRVFLKVDSRLVWQRYFEEGALVQEGQKIAEVRGNVVSLLKGERVVLNFLQHLSGVATLTRRFVDRVKKYPVQILDTRKTTPGLRALEKHAVRAGGGKNHRLGLYDRFLIKDNHLENISITEAVQRAKAQNRNRVVIEVEIGHFSERKLEDQIEEAIAAGADLLLLDNLSPRELKKIVSQVHGRVRLEASGGITIDHLEDYAKTGVDFISIGFLTHSAPAVDISMQISS